MVMEGLDVKEIVCCRKNGQCMRHLQFTLNYVKNKFKEFNTINVLNNRDYRIDFMIMSVIACMEDSAISSNICDDIYNIYLSIGVRW